MQQIVPTQRLVEGFSPSPLPPLVDGAPQLEPAPTDPLPLAPISLCELGPCINFHRMVTRIDAQGPLDGGEVNHTMVTRTCYPAPGVEADLSGHPVRDCNRYLPTSPVSAKSKANEIAQFNQREPKLRAAFEESWANVPLADDQERG